MKQVPKPARPVRHYSLDALTALLIGSTVVLPLFFFGLGALQSEREILRISSVI